MSYSGYNYLESISKFGSNLGLERVAVLLDLMKNPQDKLKYVHVAGTNGKGSTCSMIASILMESGLRVGKFISPHLEEFNERISVNNVCISHTDIDRLVDLIKEKIDCIVKSGMEHPTQFEVETAMGFQYFYEQECDVVVLEVGLGGRLDSTNVIKSPLVSVITSISYDHTERLGSSLTEIAAEKAGIIKPGCPAVSYPQTKEVYEVIRKNCRDKGCSLVEINNKSIIGSRFEGGYEVFTYEGYKNLKLKLLGRHQLVNASVAIKSIEQLRFQGFNITDRAIYSGLEKAEHKGRFEVLGHEPEFIIDGAHNTSGIQTLKDSLERYYTGKKLVLVMAVLSTKDYCSMVDIIAPMSDICIVSEPINDKALPAKDLGIRFASFCKNTLIIAQPEKAVEKAIEMAGKDGVVCCFGSLYFIGHVRQYYFKIFRAYQ